MSLVYAYKSSTTWAFKDGSTSYEVQVIHGLIFNGSFWTENANNLRLMMNMGTRKMLNCTSDSTLAE